MTNADDYAYFHMCPICGETDTVPGVTDHTCDPDRLVPQFVGFLARHAAEPAPPAEPCDTRPG
jgi:hypothetical protein